MALTMFGDDRHAYVRRLAKLVKKRGIVFDPGLYEVWVRHDGWCEINRGGFCGCKPDVKISKSPRHEDN